MFVLLGSRVTTESIPGAEPRVIDCKRCGVPRKHLQKAVTRTATAFTMPVANVHANRVWECMDCGAQLARPETARWLGEQGDTLLGRFQGWVEKGAEQVEEVLQTLEITPPKTGRSQPKASSPPSARAPERPAPEPDEDPPADAPRRPMKRHL